MMENSPRLSGLFDALPVIIWTTDAQFRLTELAGGCAELLGPEPRRLTGRRIGDLERVAAHLVEAHATTLETGASNTAFSLGEHTFETTLRRLRRGRKVVGVAGIALDVTERLISQEALAESEARFRRIAEQAPDVIYRLRLVPPDGFEYDYVSPMLETLTGYTPEEFYENPLLSLEMLHPEDRDVLDSLADPATYRVIAKDGSIRWFERRNTIVPGPDGTPAFVEGIARDITQAKELEQQLRQAQKLEAIGQLAGGIAHDFNNMLTAIGGYTELALEQIGDGPGAHELRHAARAAEQAAALTQQLLAFGRRREPTVVALDVNRVVRSVEPMLRRVIEEHVVLDLELAPELPSVRADDSQLHQVLLNLVVNARDAMPGGGTVLVRTRGLGRHVLLEVVDEGVGMDAATAARALDPFFTTKEAGRGTGLGLAIVQGIVEQLGGSLTLESSPGTGTAARIVLPATF